MSPEQEDSYIILCNVIDIVCVHVIRASWFVTVISHPPLNETIRVKLTDLARCIRTSEVEVHGQGRTLLYTPCTVGHAPQIAIAPYMMHASITRERH